ncbi:EF-hand domain-containing protein [Wenxinia marina]|uniref:EF-hand domain-containing protein n=1 Tax=Wenxinia marina DSM 24838 TaxID=1123501 RepID=A0A0D0QBT2_9RHOB|nr:EF-hand domain-containing protein [Wenxinia marina]KIQ68418.1 hypothetical protein Wenmar_03065 [Wenxinia marina DSM 24838]GGL72394.1 hypothetical protein GCM10011392_28710 [Wenxinia marina]
MHKTHTTATALTLALAATGALAQSAETPVSPFCEAAFIQGDTDSDGYISPEEAAAIASGAYENIDADEDGTITRDELAACTEAAAEATLAATDDPAAGFDEMDSDRSGQIESGEIVAQLRNLEASGGAATTGWAEAFVMLPGGDTAAADDAGDAGTEMADAGAEQTADASTMTDGTTMQAEQMASRLGQALRLLDANNDQGLSREEWEARGADREQMIEAELDRMFGSLDTDASGDISREEYMNAADARMGRATEQTAADGGAEAGGPMPVIYYYVLR